MNKHLLYPGAFAAMCVATLVPSSRGAEAPPNSPAASTVTSRLPINLARGSLGTRLVAQEPDAKSTEKSALQENSSAQALISDDAALTYPLKAGKTSIILKLERIQVLSHFNFINFGAAGKYTVSISSTKLGFDAQGWRAVANGESFDNAQVVSCELGSAEGRYVKVDFEADRPGRISGMGLFGAPSISNYQQKPLGYSFVSGSPGIAGFSPSESRNVYFDLANLDAGARVVALSRGGDLDGAQSIIDGNAESSFAFDSTDPAPAVVVDFGARRSVNRLSCVFEAPAGRLDFYLVDNPYRKDEERVTLGYVGEPTVQPVANVSGEYSGRDNSKGRQAIYSVDTSTQPGLNRLAADLSGQKGRFLVAEFHPMAAGVPVQPAGDFKDHDFKDRDFKDNFKDTAVPEQPFRVLSLSAFGQVPNNDVVPNLPTPNNTPNSPTNPPPQAPVFPPGEPVRIVTP